MILFSSLELCFYVSYISPKGCGSSRMQLQLKNEELWAENAQLRSDNDALKA
jgi:hypothetical protein